MEGVTPFVLSVCFRSMHDFQHLNNSLKSTYFAWAVVYTYAETCSNRQRCLSETRIKILEALDFYFSKGTPRRDRSRTKKTTLLKYPIATILWLFLIYVWNSKHWSLTFSGLFDNLNSSGLLKFVILAFTLTTFQFINSTATVFNFQYSYVRL